jgi:hypothetical protein
MWLRTTLLSTTTVGTGAGNGRQVKPIPAAALLLLQHRRVGMVVRKVQACRFQKRAAHTHTHTHTHTQTLLVRRPFETFAEGPSGETRRAGCVGDAGSVVLASLMSSASRWEGAHCSWCSSLSPTMSERSTPAPKRFAIVATTVAYEHTSSPAASVS